MLAGFAVNALAGLIIAALLTRMLDPADVGLYFLAFSLVLTGSALLQLGMNRSVVRFVAQAVTRDEYRRARTAIAKALLAIALLGATTALLLNTRTGKMVIDAWFPASGIGAYVLVLSVWLVGSALRSETAEAFRGLHDIRMAALAQRILPNVLFAGALGAIWWTGLQITIGQVFLIVATAGWAIFIVTGLMMWRRMRHSAGTESIGYREMLAASMPLFVSQALVLTMSQAPLWVLGGTQSGPEIADFGTALRLAHLTSVPLLVANNVLLPTVASLYGAGEHNRLSRLLTASAAVVSIPATVIFAVFALSGSSLLGMLFGDAYRDADTTLLILSGGLLINVFSGSATVALAMSGHERDVLKSAALAALTGVVATVALVPRYGAEGAAIAHSLGIVIYNLALCWHSQTILNLRTYLRPASIVALKGLVSRRRRGPEN